MNNELIKLLFSQYGTTEISGQKDNPEVLKYFREAGFSDSSLKDETAWCSAFANWIANNLCLERSNQLTARSWLKVGYKVTDPEPGDIVVLWRVKPNSWQGHVGFYINQDENNIYILGGNQSNQVCISPYPKERLLQYRRLRTV